MPLPPDNVGPQYPTWPGLGPLWPQLPGELGPAPGAPGGYSPFLPELPSGGNGGGGGPTGPTQPAAPAVPQYNPLLHGPLASMFSTLFTGGQRRGVEFYPTFFRTLGSRLFKLLGGIRLPPPWGPTPPGRGAGKSPEQTKDPNPFPWHPLSMPMNPLLPATWR